jgi:hypothetical protein
MRPLRKAQSRVDRYRFMVVGIRFETLGGEAAGPLADEQQACRDVRI